MNRHDRREMRQVSWWGAGFALVLGLLALAFVAMGGLLLVNRPSWLAGGMTTVGLLLGLGAVHHARGSRTTARVAGGAPSASTGPQQGSSWVPPEVEVRMWHLALGWVATVVWCLAALAVLLYGVLVLVQGGAPVLGLILTAVGVVLAAIGGWFVVGMIGVNREGRSRRR